MRDDFFPPLESDRFWFPALVSICRFLPSELKGKVDPSLAQSSGNHPLRGVCVSSSLGALLQGESADCSLRGSQAGLNEVVGLFLLLIFPVLARL